MNQTRNHEDRLKIDLHLHSHYSPDSILRIEDAFAISKFKGLNGISITDHDTSKAWAKAKQCAKENGMLFIQGEEVSIKENGKKVGEILALFLTEEIKTKQDISAEEVFDEIKSQAAIAVLQHPFDTFRKPLKNFEKHMKKIDAIEIFNSRCVKRLFNEKALELAKKCKKAVTAGSDSHTPFELGKAVTTASGFDEDDLRKAIKNKTTTAAGTYSSPLVHAISTAKSTLVRLGGLR